MIGCINVFIHSVFKESHCKDHDLLKKRGLSYFERIFQELILVVSKSPGKLMADCSRETCD